MSRKSFDYYGTISEKLSDYTQIAGRHSFQKSEEKRIIGDIIAKLEISTLDDCLDIGCGTGNVLMPLSFFAASATGIDHPSCIKKLQERALGTENIELISGNFLDFEFERKFDKIIVYSVLHYLTDVEEVLTFMKKAIQCLKPYGKLLLGDIPNTSKRERFNKSEKGILINAKWAETVRNNASKTENIMDIFLEDTDKVVFNDEIVMRMLAEARACGCESYLLKQSASLPFNNTREDILIEKID